MRRPVTGKEPIDLPLELKRHRQHTCIDLSPYNNEQILASACTNCDLNTDYPTASDALVSFINQTNGFLQNRRFYYGFRKHLELLDLLPSQPQIFQIYWLLQNNFPDIKPIIACRDNRLRMYIFFTATHVHLPAACLQQVLAAATDSHNVVVHITHGHIAISTCPNENLPLANVRIDIEQIRRRVQELEIPHDINEHYEQFHPLISGLA